MKDCLSIPLVVLAFAYITAAAEWEHSHKKSFYTVQQECADAYRINNDTLCQIITNGCPQDNQTCSLVYCMLTKMRAWENNTVKENVLGNFFQPADSDCTYVNRTQQCINDTVPPVCQSTEIDRACKAFLCYYRNYGEVKSEPQFLPFSQTELIWLAKLALQITNASCDDLAQMSNGNVTDNAAFAPAYYSFGLDAGWYDPINGYNFHQGYTQYGNATDLTEQTRACVTQVGRASCSEPQRVVDIVGKCFGLELDSLLFQQAATELGWGINATCVICASTPAPCQTSTEAPVQTPCGSNTATVTEYPVTNSTDLTQNTTLPNLSDVLV